MATKSENLNDLLKVDLMEKATNYSSLSPTNNLDVKESSTDSRNIGQSSDSAVLEQVNQGSVEVTNAQPPASSDSSEKIAPASDKTNKTLVDIALTQMNFSPAAKKILLDPQGATKDLDSLTSIAATQEHLVQVKKSLGHIIDSIQENPSIISRAAKAWGNFELWQKILGGVVLSGPTLVIGAVSHIGILLTISGATVIAYTTSGIILDDHHVHTKNITEKLKAGIFGIAEVLELTIAALDNIRQKLAYEVKRFQDENDKLAKNITLLNGEIDRLTIQTELFIATEVILRNKKNELEKLSEALKKDLEDHKQQAEINQKEVELIREAHKKSILQLTGKVEELAQVRQSLSLELNKAKMTASTLEGTVKALSTAAISDKNQRQNFQDRLSTFLNNKSEDFNQIADRMSKTEQELSQVKSDLQTSNTRYKDMLIYQEKLITRLEKLDKNIESSINPKDESVPIPANTKDTTKQSLLSFFTLPQVWPIVPTTPLSSNNTDTKTPIN